MLTVGICDIEGVPVEVVRKRIRRINLHVRSDGSVALSVPKWWATMAEAEAFLRSKWSWVLKAREQMLARAADVKEPISPEEMSAFTALVAELHGKWSVKTGELGVAWRIRRVKTVWGSCNWRTRTITYNAELARKPREQVEYVVVHEFTHFAVHGHGPGFYKLMDARLPGWRELRKSLHGRKGS